VLSKTARILAGALALTLAYGAAPATAGTRHLAHAVLLGSHTSAQNSDQTSPPMDKRAQADDLLQRARQAISENDLEAAEKLVSQAEALGVSYGPFHLGDTPKKVRKELERRREQSQSNSTAQRRFPAPFGFGRKEPSAPSSDPFAGRLESSRQPAAGAGSQPASSLPSFIRFGSRASSAPSEQLHDAGSSASARAGESTGEALELLHAARRALAVGDLRRARGLVQQARNLQARYTPQDDTPEAVEAAIEQYDRLLADRQSTESWRRAYARMLLKQAEALLRYRDFDEAERLAEEAARQAARLTPAETTPQALLDRIAAARRGAAAGGPAGRPVGSATSIPSSSSRAAGASDKAARARELVRLARQALNAGQVARADQLAREAESMGLPDAAFAPGELPAMVLLDVRTARARALMRGSDVVPAAAHEVVPAAGQMDPRHTASRAVYDPSRDTTRNVPAGATATDYRSPAPRYGDLAQGEPTPAPPEMPAVPPPAGTTPAGQPRETVGMALFRQGEEALRAHDVERAYQFFQQAARYQDELDPMTAQRLQDHLQLLSAPGAIAFGSRDPTTGGRDCRRRVDAQRNRHATAGVGTPDFGRGGPSGGQRPGHARKGCATGRTNPGPGPPEGGKRAGTDLAADRP